MSVPYYGDYPEDHAEIRIPFNTLDSNDPSASVTITNLADADIEVHADGDTTQIATDGATVIIDFAGETGAHMILIDSSVDAAYTTATEYAVKIVGTTVDGATLNVWVGTFSIERAGGALATALLTNTVVDGIAAKLVGITLLNEWLGAIAGKQNADATALTELKATGAGSGTYDPNNDSVEALRDFNVLTDASVTAIQDKLVGITLLNEWLGAMAGKQNADSTALTEIKATGAASGTYDPNTDSTEALRDLTGASVTTIQNKLVGITLLNEWLGAIMGKQNADSTALTEIKATGAASGSYDPNTDSQEALNDVGVNVRALSGDSGAADILEAIMDGTILAQVNDASATTTAFASNNQTGGEEGTDDHFKGRLITFRTGALKGQQTDIVSYDASGGAQGSFEFTVTALTEAPANDDFFTIT